ncbi:hypothetical protein GCM10027321_41820 [Massilia terrae]|uniref:PsiF repeat-containing protein n=1 Tax=Massilia terrae TaxID=1811224 RepID=A0ABT2CZD4_9BURK|nr:hypothetical protein [Massilia terrae]MCS0659339.1 hypothetical protein [Massilia terrae]
MKRVIALLAGCVLSFSALAQAPAPAASDSGASCEAKAMDKNGKALAGAAKKSFMKKCEHEMAAASCEGKAMDKNGKPLAGAAKKSFMKKCEMSAK